MACMCGDLYCGSCGPAQGNHKCSGCGKWSMDGPCDDQKKCADIIAAVWNADMDGRETEQYYADMQEDEKYWTS